MAALIIHMPSIWSDIVCHHLHSSCSSNGSASFPNQNPLTIYSHLIWVNKFYGDPMEESLAEAWSIVPSCHRSSIFLAIILTIIFAIICLSRQCFRTVRLCSVCNINKTPLITANGHKILNSINNAKLSLIHFIESEATTNTSASVILWLKRRQKKKHTRPNIRWLFSVWSDS